MNNVRVWKPRVNFTVYQIHNTINGRYYVGSTKDGYTRLYKHRWDLDSGNHKSHRLQEDWLQFGAEAFVFEVIEEGISEADRFGREQYWADVRKAWRDGYNQQPDVASSAGRVCDADTRRRIADATLRQFAEEDARSRTSAATRKAMDNTELRERLSESAKRKWADPVYREEMRKRRETGVPSQILAERSKAARKERERLRTKRRERPKKIKPFHYEITMPDGGILLAPDILTFCRMHNIWPSSVYKRLAKGKDRVHSAGYVFRRIGVPFPSVPTETHPHPLL